jgi:hypothetical protein
MMPDILLVKTITLQYNNYRILFVEFALDVIRP